MSAFDFKGITTALVTPFNKGEVDYPSLEKLVSFQLDNGIQGLVVNGTTAESPTLSAEEVKNIFNRVSSLVSGQVPIIVGTGTNNTSTSVERTIEAKELGADAALVVVPYYNKPNQRCMLAHFKKVAESTDLPQILYNVPGRTVVSMKANTAAKLSELSSVIGIKEAAGDPAAAIELKGKCAKGFVLLSGDDGSCVEFLRNGGDGVISVISNILPKMTVSISDRVRAGEEVEKDELLRFSKVNDALCMDTNPIPAKAALKHMGIITSDEMRLPMLSMEAAESQRLEKSLRELGVI